MQVSQFHNDMCIADSFSISLIEKFYLNVFKFLAQSCLFQIMNNEKIIKNVNYKHDLSVKFKRTNFDASKFSIWRIPYIVQKTFSRMIQSDCVGFRRKCAMLNPENSRSSLIIYKNKYFPRAFLRS